MNDFDKQVRDALEADQASIADDDDWRVHYEGLRSMLRGQQRWLSIITFVVMAVLITIMVVSAVQFFRVEETRSMIGWATGFAVAIVLEAIVEMWFFMEWNKNVIRREIKELQLDVASLAQQLRRGSGTQ